MRWTDLLGYVTATAPELVSTFVGVTDQEIRALETARGIQLPTSYVELLRTLGRSSGALPLFGYSLVHDWDTLHGTSDDDDDEPPSDGDYPLQRYVKIAIETAENALAYLDLFLDLGGSDGKDAPLVMAELGYEAFLPQDMNLTLLESVTKRVFTWLHLRDTRVTTVFVQLPDADAVAARKAQVLAALRARGCELAVPDQPRVTCLRGSELVALVDVILETKLLGVQLASKDPAIVAAAARDLQAALDMS